MRGTATILAILIAAGSVALAPADAAQEGVALPLETAPTCPSRALLVGVGLGCIDRASGLLETFSPLGEPLGTTHVAGDAIPVVASGPAPRAPECVEPVVVPHTVEIIYARAVDDEDRYAAMLPAIRSMVNLSNGWLHQAAVASGGIADIRTACVGGLAKVANVTLPTSLASDSFTSIVSDLRARGYIWTAAKYWVFYDDSTVEEFSGRGHVYSDDRLVTENRNNEPPAAMFAITYGRTGLSGASTMLHELTHTMGGVQASAPHSSLNGHCYDGLDVMCYDDGGTNATLHCVDHDCSGRCAVEVYDCGADDFFNRTPGPESYLATKWGVSAPHNYWLQMGPPTIGWFHCNTPKGITQGTTCSMDARANASGVRFEVFWGDPSEGLSPVPCCGYWPPGDADVTTTHFFGSGGTKEITVTVKDSKQNPGTNYMTRTVVVDADKPVTGYVLAGALGGMGWFRTPVQVKLFATDTGGTGLRNTYYWIVGPPLLVYGGPFMVTTEGIHYIGYRSDDHGDNVETLRRFELKLDLTLPTGDLVLGCETCVASVPLTWTASDALSKLGSAVVRWTYGDPVVTSGTVCSGSVYGLASAGGACSHMGALGALPGPYCFRLEVTDVAGNLYVTPPQCATLV